MAGNGLAKGLPAVALIVFVMLVVLLRMSPTTVPLSELTTASPSYTVRFIAIGDFGARNIPNNKQLEVAALLTNVSQSFHPLFIVSTGDQVYSSGITSDQDPLLQHVFEGVYTHKSLQIPWLVNIGNHDCLGDVPAMLAYARKSNKWHMPARYYTEEFSLTHERAKSDGSNVMRIIVLDTCDLVCGAAAINPRCETTMKVVVGGNKVQYKWLEQQLAKPAVWKIVVGHWPVFSFLGNGPTEELFDELLPMLRKYNVHLYLNGHDHNMQHVVSKATPLPHFVVSGAGGFPIHAELKPYALPRGLAQAELRHKEPDFGFVTVEASEAALQLQFVTLNNGPGYSFTIPRDAR
eukprot:m.213817 g.213817  ORF g.213817 m.213817 type:complete len:349 (-) comp29816_c0_seq1:404-1450(-)